MCIYTPNGKREDLWETHLKRPKVFKCHSAYMSISLCYIFQFVKSVDKWKRLREEIVPLSDCSLLVKGYSDTEFGLLY